MSKLLTKETLAEIYETWPLKEQLLGIPEEIAAALDNVKTAATTLTEAEKSLKVLEAEIAAGNEEYMKAKNDAQRGAILLAEAQKHPGWLAAQQEIKKASTVVDGFRKEHARLERLAGAFHDVVKLTVAEINLATLVIAAPEAAGSFFAEALDALAKTESES